MRAALILIFLMSWNSGAAQEKYFHDLKGFEDSTGTTHLFYRIYENIPTTCSDFENSFNTSVETNDVYHFNTSTEHEVYYLKDREELRPFCDYVFYRTPKFIHPTLDPDSVITISGTFGGLWGGYSLRKGFTNKGDLINLGIANPLGLNFDPFSKTVVANSPVYELIIKAAGQDFNLRKSFQYSLNDSLWSEIGTYHDIPDSLLIDFIVAGVSPYKEGYYVGFSDSSIILSTDYGETLVEFPDQEYLLSEFMNVNARFDADSVSFYISNGSKTFIVQPYKGNPVNEFIVGASQPIFSVDIDISGGVYFSTDSTLYFSEDYGFQSAELVQFSSKITGLYKKPNSNLLYVLTSEELIGLNVETMERKTLKLLPVSNEHVPEIPTSLQLYQNYPNPFNPSTSIGYQLTSDTYITLTIFDALGREVAILEDGLKAAGNYVTTFNAQNLSSGIYYYVLESEDFSERITRKMLLIK